MTVVAGDNKLRMTKEHEAYLSDAEILKFSNGVTFIREDIILRVMSDHLARMNNNGQGN